MLGNIRPYFNLLGHVYSHGVLKTTSSPEDLRDYEAKFSNRRLYVDGQTLWVVKGISQRQLGLDVEIPYLGQERDPFKWLRKQEMFVG